MMLFIDAVFLFFYSYFLLRIRGCVFHFYESSVLRERY
jgi:hypothetical protein